MNQWYPLRFRPLFRRYLWGGRRLESVLGKPIGDGDDYAESWEVVDHGPDQSVVASGSLAGATLHRLIAEHGPEMLGRHHPEPRFPLLMKFLDCNRDLSVQVHPNDEQAARLDPPDLGKTEAWVILHADPGSLVYAGLREGVDRRTLADCIAAGKTADCLHRFTPRIGDCVYVPAGTVHALGEGLVVAEIQQASDTTFRLYDWGRVGADGQPRALHLDRALEVIDYRAGPVSPRRTADPPVGGTERLVECNKFVLERRAIASHCTVGGDDRFHLLAVLDGDLAIADQEVGRGDVTLLPAAMGEVSLEPRGHVVLLDAFLP